MSMVIFAVVHLQDNRHLNHRKLTWVLALIPFTGAPYCYKLRIQVHLCNMLIQ